MKRILPPFLRRRIKGSRRHQVRQTVEADIYSEGGWATVPAEAEHRPKGPVTGDPLSNTPSLLTRKQ